jgi:hypothetical protein
MTLLARLRNDKSSFARRVVDELYEDPFWEERFAARGRARSENDVGFHVDYLIEAIEANDPGVLERYAKWLQNVLTTRGMCTLHLADSFGRLSRVIADPLASHYLRAGREALLYDSGSARVLQERIHDVITTGTPGHIEDTEYHLAYLADAIALGQPRVFMGHVEWLAYSFERHGKEKRALASTLEALGRTLTVEHAQDIVYAAVRELS